MGAHSSRRTTSFQPTVIILDMIMPGMDGNEIVLWLAKQRCTARLIIITGYTGLRGPRQGAGGVQRPPAGDNVEQADRRERDPSRAGFARVLLRLGSPKQPGTQSYGVRRVAWAYTNALLGRLRHHRCVADCRRLCRARGTGRNQEVVAAVAHDFYPEYMVDADGHPGGFAIDLMNAVTKRPG